MGGAFYKKHGASIQNGEGIALSASSNVFLVAGQARVQLRLANEGEVVVAAGSVRDRGAAIGGDAELGRVADAAAVHCDRAAPGVANADSVAGIAAAVDVADPNRAAIGGSSRDAAVTSRSGIRELHDVMPSLVPT